MGRLAGKVALVTGGSRGIGRGIAERLAADGAAVAINYRSGEERARDTLAAIEGRGGTGAIVAGNVANAGEATAMVAETVDKLGGLHILVNNAGISADMITVRLSEEDWDRVIDTDLKGAFLVTKAALRPLMRQRWGRIINIASVVAHTGNVGQANYAAA
ncbi:MAG TPA: SDR family NAD(P)-dependent oxidoreductase, partial [Chloroflexota bacterium]|nr:SDR family NAD(P)-dependent oxidoreductase [Chloroflexota bacterium]